MPIATIESCLFAFRITRQFKNREGIRLIWHQYRVPRRPSNCFGVFVSASLSLVSKWQGGPRIFLYDSRLRLHLRERTEHGIFGRVDVTG